MIFGSNQKLLMARAGVPSAAGGWDVSTASFLQSFSVSAQDGQPIDLSFSPDGLSMYMLGNQGKDVNQYALSTAWNVSTASFVRNYVVSSQTTTPRGLDFKPDGSKMYVGGLGLIHEYDLSTPWDISTTAFVQSESVASQGSEVMSVFFREDGIKVYTLDIGTDNVNEYDLSVAWDISTISFVQSFSVATQETSPTDVFFKPDGSKMYVVGFAGDDVNEYDLSLAWDISTSVYLQSFVLLETNPYGLFFRPDGLKMYTIGISLDRVDEYDIR